MSALSALVLAGIAILSAVATRAARSYALSKQLKIMAPGGQATPSPPLGPALGANGINPGQFIQAFNERTKDLNGKVVGCIITLFHDRSFEFEIKSSPAAVLIAALSGQPAE